MDGSQTALQLRVAGHGLAWGCRDVTSRVRTLLEVRV